MPEERKKPPYISKFDMSHVPPPNPENFWKLLLNEPRVIFIDPKTSEPMLTITVREIDGQRISLQITAAPLLPTYEGNDV